MLLKKLAKLRRAILWCAVFAVSHLAFGAEIEFYYNWTGRVDNYFVLENADKLHGRLDVKYDWNVTENHYTAWGAQYVEYITNRWDKITVTAVPDTGYSFDNKWTIVAWDKFHSVKSGSWNLNQSAINFFYNDSQNIASDWYCHFAINFEPNVYTVTFVLDGGAFPVGVPAYKDVTFDSAYGELPTPTRAHNDFSGWTLDGKSVTPNTVVKTAAEHELTATWKEHPKYTVTVSTANVQNIQYCIDDGQAYDLSADNRIYNVYSNSCVKVWAQPKVGYSFAYTSVQNPQKIAAVTASANTLSLVATANKYKVSFDLSCETSPPTPITVTYDSTYGSLPTPTRVGYEFLGWYLGETRISDSTKVTITADHTLVAHWEKKSYVLTTTVSPTGKGSISRSSDSSRYEYETAITLTAVPATGYSFDHWDDNSELSETREITIRDTADNSNANKYSVTFKPNSYTVSFDIAPDTASVKPSTSTTPSSLDPITVTYDAEYGVLPSVSHIEYKFLGWFTDPNHGAPVTSSTVFKTPAPVTLYAHWEKLPRYRVTLVKGDNVASIYYKRDKEDAEWYSDESVEVISNLTISAYAVALSGYTAKNPEENPFVSDPILTPSTFTLTATPNTYTVTFDSNGGALPNGVPSTKDVEYDSPYGDLPIPISSGRKFLGWFTDPNGGDAVVSSTVFKTAASLTLYAHWEAFNLDLTAAADCVGLMLRSDRADFPFLIDDTECTVGLNCVYFASTSQSVLDRSTGLSSDIVGTGKLSFDWWLQNSGRDAGFTAIAELLITDAEGNVTRPCKFTNEFGANKFPVTDWESVEIELTDVVSVKWQVSGENARTQFYLDNVRWIPEGSEKTELEKWAELLGLPSSATQDDVDRELAAFKLTITLGDDGEPAVSVLGDKPYADKVKIECCEDLSNPTWNEHNPTQHSKCRFYRGTLELDP